MNRKPVARLNNWSSELIRSMPKSYLIESPRDRLLNPSKPIVKKTIELLKDLAD